MGGHYHILFSKVSHVCMLDLQGGLGTSSAIFDLSQRDLSHLTVMATLFNTCATWSFTSLPSNVAPSVVNSYQHIQGSSMATDLIHITQSLSPRIPGSSDSPDGLLDGPVTGQRCTDCKESVEVQIRGRLSNQCL